MAEIIDIRKGIIRKPTDEMTMDEFIQLHPEMLGEELDKQADELIEKIGTLEIIEKHRMVRDLEKESENMGDSEFEERRRERISQKLEDMLSESLDLFDQPVVPAKPVTECGTVTIDSLYHKGLCDESNWLTLKKIARNNSRAVIFGSRESKMTIYLKALAHEASGKRDIIYVSSNPRYVRIQADGRNKLVFDPHDIDEAIRSFDPTRGHVFIEDENENMISAGMQDFLEHKYSFSMIKKVDYRSGYKHIDPLEQSRLIINETCKDIDPTVRDIPDHDLLIKKRLMEFVHGTYFIQIYGCRCEMIAFCEKQPSQKKI